MRLFLRQTRGVFAWSDGNRILEGADLSALREAVLHRLISARASKTDPGEETNARAWRNYHQLDRIRAKRDPGEGLGPRMRADLLTAMTGTDPGSAERKRLLRRSLKRVAPDLWGSLPIRTRSGEREAERIIEAGMRAGFRVRSDLIVDGFTIKAGTPALMDHSGRVRLGLPGLEHFPTEGLRADQIDRKKPPSREARGFVSGPDKPDL